MDKDLLKIQLHKFLTQHQYLTSLLCETKYLFNKYNKKFLEEYYEEDELEDYKTKKQEEIDKKLEENINLKKEEKEESCEEKLEEDNSQSPILSKLYKKLSLKTHPDKVPDQIEVFKRVSAAYKKNDILTLIVIAYELKMDIIDIIEDQGDIVIENLNKNIENIDKEINDLKHTVAWLWVNASDEEKQQYKKQNKK